MDSAHPVPYVQVVLEAERNSLRVTRDQQIVRYFVRIDRARCGPASNQELFGGFPGLISRIAKVNFVAGRFYFGSLCLAMAQQTLQSFRHRWVGIVGKNYAPSCFL